LEQKATKETKSEQREIEVAPHAPGPVDEICDDVTIVTMNSHLAKEFYRNFGGFG